MSLEAHMKVPLKGSERRPAGNRIGNQPPDEIVEISVILKPKHPVPPTQTGEPILSREEFAARYGADPAAVAKVESFARDHGLKVEEVSLPRRTVTLSGTAAQMSKAFDTQFEQCHYRGRNFRARTGPIMLSEDLASSIEAVLGLDDRAQAKAHFRVFGANSARASAQPAVSYSPPQVAQLYNFPTGVDGTGQTVGIIELGGGYKPADLQNYFNSLGLQKQPTVISVSVDKAANSPTTPDGPDGEVLMDIEIAGAVAPGARIIVYFAPNTSRGYQDALTTAIHDATNKPSVISTSWGNAESTWTAQSMSAFESAAQDAAALGVTICAASGDDGSSDGETDGQNHVDFPASAPHVLGCGGTTLESAKGAITSETAWNDGPQGGSSGGGFSTQFPMPSWQTAAKIKAPSGAGRGVPDVAGDADPNTGYNVLVDGQKLVIAGCSAVAPLWSGLIALMNQELGKPVGFFQPTLYALPGADGAFRDITSGNNGAFSTGPGWDAVTGLGSPNGADILAALSSSSTVTRNRTGSQRQESAQPADAGA
jgi:kumamolisin